jgi:hypothetical protein
MTAYREPPVFVVRVFNPVVSFLVWRLGPENKRGLEVRRRNSGAWRGVPVDGPAVGKGHYLVYPRGETPWVKNLSAADSAGSRGSPLRRSRTTRSRRCYASSSRAGRGRPRGTSPPLRRRPTPGSATSPQSTPSSRCGTRTSVVPRDYVSLTPSAGVAGRCPRVSGSRWLTGGSTPPPPRLGQDEARSQRPAGDPDPVQRLGQATRRER